MWERLLWRADLRTIVPLRENNASNSHRCQFSGVVGWQRRYARCSSPRFPRSSMEEFLFRVVSWGLVLSIYEVERWVFEEVLCGVSVHHFAHTSLGMMLTRAKCMRGGHKQISALWARKIQAQIFEIKFKLWIWMKYAIDDSGGSFFQPRPNSDRWACSVFTSVFCTWDFSPMGIATN